MEEHTPLQSLLVVGNHPLLEVINAKLNNKEEYMTNLLICFFLSLY